MTRPGLKLLLCLLLLLSACQPAPQESPPQPYRIAIAGHIYGNAVEFTEGVHPPFLTRFRTLQKNHPVDLLVLTGDTVAEPTPERWATALEELKKLGVDLLVSRGSHDTGPEIEALQPAHTVVKKIDHALIIVLNTTHSGWTLAPDQVPLVKEALAAHPKVENIFVFSHQLWWLREPPPEFEIKPCETNSRGLFEGESTFWMDVFPLFAERQEQVYFFAGDLGCYGGVKPYYEDHHRNFHFYGSGMGARYADNFLLAEVDSQGRVAIKRVDFGTQTGNGIADVTPPSLVGQ